MQRCREKMDFSKPMIEAWTGACWPAESAVGICAGGSSHGQAKVDEQMESALEGDVF